MEVDWLFKTQIASTMVLAGNFFISIYLNITGEMHFMI